MIRRDAVDQLAALSSKQIGAVELLELALAHHGRTHARINAVTGIDAQRAFDAARAIDAQRAKGAALGPLAGLPMTIKDTLDVSGLAATSGLAALLGRPATDAVAVAHARRAGAVIWGKTNVPVMAADWQSHNTLYGTTCNPWDATRTPGGSSGGAAAALAAGVTALEIGSDIAGSLRVPAGFCGVYSHKPTWGRVSQRGHVPPAPGAHAERDLNVIGPMARSARDLRLLLAIIEGAPAPARFEAADLKRLRIGLWLDEPAFALDTEVKAAIESHAHRLQAAGAQLRPIASPVDVAQLLPSFRTLLGSVVATDLPPRAFRKVQRLRGPAGLALRFGLGGAGARMIRAYAASHAEWLAADEARARLCRAVEAVFEIVDVILAPVTPVVAFPHDHSPFGRRTLACSNGRRIPYHSLANWISLATTCHLPVTTVPAGCGASGLPVGVQIIGPRGGDALTLAVAQAIDEQVGGFVAPAQA